MLFRVTALFLFVFLAQFVKADKYYVFFTNKAGQSLDPYEYFTKKAIERRIRCGVSLVQHSDLPVNPNYINKVSQLSDSITVVSRWLNMVCIHSSSKEVVAQIRRLPFVSSVVRVISNQKFISKRDTITEIDEEKQKSFD